MKFLIPLILGACAHKDRLHPFELQTDPTGISVWGLQFSEPTEWVQELTPLLDTHEAVGAVAFDAKERVVFTANGDGVYTAHRVADHTLLWRRVHGDPLSMPPLFVPKEAVRAREDIVIFGSQNGKVFGVTAERGNALWMYDLGGELRSKPVVTQGRLLVTNARNQLVALDVLTGKWIWQYTRDFPVQMTILGHSGVTVRGSSAYVGFSDGFVCAVNLEDGLLQWSRPLTLSSQGFSDADTTPQLIADKVFAASVHDGVHALRASNGEVLWQLRAQNITRLVAHDPYLIAISTSGTAYGIDSESGKALWTFKFPPAEITQPIAYRGYVTFGTKPGGLFVLEESTGRLVQHFYPGGIVSELAHKGPLLGFLSEGNFLYVMRYGERTGVQLQARHRFQGL